MRPVAAGQLGRDQGPRQHGDVRQDRQHHPGQAQVGRVLVHSGGELPVQEQGHHQLQRQPGPGGRQHVVLCSSLDQDQGGLLMVRGWRGVYRQKLECPPAWLIQITETLEANLCP